MLIGGGETHGSRIVVGAPILLPPSPSTEVHFKSFRSNTASSEGWEGKQKKRELLDCLFYVYILRPTSSSTFQCGGDMRLANSTCRLDISGH